MIKTHAEQLRVAKLDEWDIPRFEDGRRRRKAAYVVPPQSNSSDESSEMDTPLAQLTRRMRKELDNSTDEDDIPLDGVAETPPKSSMLERKRRPV